MKPWDNTETIAETFWNHVFINEHGCWEWTKAKDEDGYGKVCFEGKDEYAHRVAWKLKNGNIPKGRFVLHHCDNPSCINPDHLFIGTAKDNAIDCCRKHRNTDNRGEKHGLSKLNSFQILEIKKSVKLQKKIALEYGIDQSQVSRIKSLQSWSHI